MRNVSACCGNLSHMASRMVPTHVFQRATSNHTCGSCSPPSTSAVRSLSCGIVPATARARHRSRFFSNRSAIFPSRCRPLKNTTCAWSSFFRSPEPEMYLCGSTPAAMSVSTCTRSPPTRVATSATMVVVQVTRTGSPVSGGGPA